MKPIFEIVPIYRLKPLEYVFPHHLSNLESMITDTINKPLIVDSNTGTILDGSHRYIYFFKNGFNEVPVWWIDYNDDRISTGISMSKEEIIKRKGLLPPRTTRHKFPFTKDDVPVKLNTLDKGEVRDASHLIWNSTKEEELLHNLGYLHELKESERYILQQIGMLKEKAVFPGKFNPPHIGHAATILKLKERYDLEVVVTGDIPEDSILSQDEIVNEIRNLLVNVSKIEGKLTDLKENPFDCLVISGNSEVGEWCKKVGAEYKYIERSGNLEAKMIRNARNS
jgi:hypothetical protein